MPRPSEKYKHAVKNKQQRAGGGSGKRAAKPRPGAKKRPTAGQSRAANKLKGEIKNGKKIKKKSNQGSKSRGNRKALPKRVEKKKVTKQSIFGKLIILFRCELISNSWSAVGK